MSQQSLVHSSPRPSQRNLLLGNTVFPMGPAPPTCPNTNPHCNSLALFPTGLPLAASPLKRATWASYLAEYPDHGFVDALLNIIDVGASIGHMGTQKSQSCKNLRSALDHPSIISKEIDGLLKEGRIHGPCEAPPLANFSCSPLGPATRKRNPKCRVFNHYSWPRDASVNEETPDFERSEEHTSELQSHSDLV